jgi:ADP-heptose:LPS heptosyltransferase
VKQKKAIVFFSAGLGDAVLLIPSVKWLKKEGYHVSGFFNSPHPCEDIFKDTALLDEIQICRSKSSRATFAFTHRLKYDLALVNYFAANRSNLSIAGMIASQVRVNRKTNSFVEKLFHSSVLYTEPAGNLHDAEQNLLLAGKQEPRISVEDLYIGLVLHKTEELSHPFMAVQVSAGNNKFTYKNWPVKYWVGFLKMLQIRYPGKKIILLGDENETDLSAQITGQLKDHVHSLIGKTSVKEVMNILAQCELFIGLDGGLMHLAAALKKPTFTIWGPSSKSLYGYEKMDPQRHKCVSLSLSCSPCSAWIQANHTRVRGPELCPDHACMQQLLPQEVFDQFRQYVNSLEVHAG